MTALALALINVGLAGFIAFAVTSSAFLPPWLAVVLLVVGMVAAGWAVVLWRRYLSSAHAP